MLLGVGKADIPSADLPNHCVPHRRLQMQSAYTEADVRLSREKKENKKSGGYKPEPTGDKHKNNYGFTA